jgi:MraZ protein
VYFGESTSKIDDKGRITVPRRIRDTMDVLGHAIWYMTRGFDGAVFLFPKEEWDKIRQQARQFSSMDAKVLDFRRLFFSSVAEAKPDAQGRMAVPPHLREHAGIEKEAVLIGVDDHLELWSKEGWRAFVERREQEYKQMAAPIFAPEAASGSESASAEKGGLEHAS